jgi:hypothetical protein
MSWYPFRSANKLELDVVFTPVLRDWLHEDTYSDVTVLSLLMPSHDSTHYHILVQRKNLTVSLTRCWERNYICRVVYDDGTEGHCARRFLDLLENFVTTVAPALNHAAFYAWHWRKDWIAACVISRHTSDFL